jgi:hypothetical protein
VPRAMTKKLRNLDSAVMMSSVMPSAVNEMVTVFRHTFPKWNYSVNFAVQTLHASSR